MTVYYRNADGELVSTDENAADLVDAAIAAREEAERLEIEHSSEPRWREADCYAKLSAAPHEFSTRAIAKHCEVSHNTVSRFLRCVELYPVDTERPAFTDALCEVRSDQGKPVEDLTDFQRFAKRLATYYERQLNAAGRSRRSITRSRRRTTSWLSASGRSRSRRRGERAQRLWK
jgi:hypothetical protein